LVQSRQLCNTLLEFDEPVRNIDKDCGGLSMAGMEIRKIGDLRRIRPGEPTPPVAMNSKLAGGANYGFRMRRMNVHDSSGNHRDIQACLADNSRDFWQVFFHALRQNMSSFSHRQIDTIKPQFGGGLSHLLPVEPLQVF